MPYHSYAFLLNCLHSFKWVLRSVFYVILIEAKLICETEVTPLDFAVLRAVWGLLVAV